MTDRAHSRPYNEDDHLLRKTFTWRFEDPKDAAALGRVVGMLADWLLESLQIGPKSSRDPIAQEIRPAGEDLCLLGGYLRQVARHRQESSLTPEQRHLCDRAAAWAKKADALGRKILAATGAA